MEREMLLDINLLLSTAQAITVTAPSSFVIDLAGVGTGVPDPNTFGTAATTIFGQDIGIGDGVSPPNLLCVVTTTFVGGTSLQVQLQSAPDTPTNTGTPGTYTTIVQTAAYATAVLVKGVKLAEFTIPPTPAGITTFPRFYRLNYVVVGTYTAGTVQASIITGRDDQPAYPANF